MKFNTQKDKNYDALQLLQGNWIYIYTHTRVTTFLVKVT